MYPVDNDQTKLEMDQIFSIEITISAIEIWFGPHKNVEKEWFKEISTPSIEKISVLAESLMIPPSMDPVKVSNTDIKDVQEEIIPKPSDESEVDCLLGPRRVEKKKEEIEEPIEVVNDEPPAIEPQRIVEPIKSDIPVMNETKMNYPYRISIGILNVGKYFLDQVDYENELKSKEEVVIESKSSEEEFASDKSEMSEVIGGADSQKTGSAKKSSQPISAKEAAASTGVVETGSTINEGPVDPKKLTAALKALQKTQESEKKEKEKLTPFVTKQEKVTEKEEEKGGSEPAPVNETELEGHTSYCCCCIETSLPEPEMEPEVTIPPWEKWKDHKLAKEGWKKFNRGIFLMLINTPTNIIKNLQKSAIMLAFNRYNGHDPMISVGQTRIQLQTKFTEAVYRSTKTRPETPVSIDLEDDTYPIKNTEGEVIGSVAATITLKCFGNMFISRCFGLAERSLYEGMKCCNYLVYEKPERRTFNFYTMNPCAKEKRYREFFQMAPKDRDNQFNYKYIVNIN